MAHATRLRALCRGEHVVSRVRYGRPLGPGGELAGVGARDDALAQGLRDADATGLEHEQDGLDHALHLALLEHPVDFSFGFSHETLFLLRWDLFIMPGPRGHFSFGVARL